MRVSPCPPVVALVSLACVLALADRALATPVKCKAAVIKGGAAFVQTRAKALQKCRDGVVRGKLALSPGTTCATEPKTAAAIAKAVTKLDGTIANACGGKNKHCDVGDTGDDADDLPADVGFPAVCPNFESGGCTNAIADCDDVASCLQCIDGVAVDQAIAFYYDALAPTDPTSKDKAQKALIKCQTTIGKAAAKFLGTKAKLLAKCWTAVNKTAAGSCPDAGATTAIAAAEQQERAAIGKACAGPDKTLGTPDDLTPSAIGFPSACLDAVVPSCAGPVGTLAELIDCVACVTDFKVDCADAAAVPAFVDPYPAECNAGAPIATPTDVATSTPIATPTPDATSTSGDTPTATPTTGDTPTETPTTPATPAATVTPHTVTLDAVSSGFYRDDGFHEPDNYAVGWYTHSTPDHIELRDYFVFDLSTVAGTISAASLHLSTAPPGFIRYGSSDPSETYTLFDVSTPLATLTNGGGTAAFDDIGSGTTYGSITATNAIGATVDVELDATGIAFLQGSSGQVAFGGAITTLAKGDSSEFLFNATSASLTRQLVITIGN